MSRAEGSLLDFGKVVARVAVQNELADGHQRVVAVRPDLGHVENVPLVVVALLLGDNLDVDGPCGRLPRLDVVEKIAGSVIRVFGTNLRRFLVREGLYDRVGN